ncbi:MAG: D-alanine--D-alanine ligase [Verrucomicrobia bacterium]|nr:D-alanine--D-alanine ligase [Verrucomicrobiota bacterium]
MKTRNEKVAVLMGGPSAEREVSLRSGAAVSAGLRRAGWRVCDVDVRGPDFVLEPDTAVAFLALHGTFGEDGTLQRLLEERGVAYTGCGVQASHDCFDKAISKRIFEAAGVPSARYEVLAASGPRRVTLPLPVVVKAACQGSSVGVTIVRDAGALDAALADAFRYGEHAVVEEFVAGRETTVGILGETALPVVEVRPKSGVYDYKSKYTTGATEYEVPARLSEATTHAMQEVALAAFRAAGCRDYSRVDFLLSQGDERPYVLEINTLPGMTETSLLPKAAAAAGIGFEELCSRMVTMALERRVRNV